MKNLMRWAGVLPWCWAFVGCAAPFNGTEGPRVVITYRADAQDSPPALANFALIVPALERRLKSLKIPRVVRQSGPQEVEVILGGPPTAMEVDHVKRLVASCGKLEFRIVANVQDHARLIELATAAEASPRVVLKENGEPAGFWASVPANRLADITASPVITRQNAAGETEMLLANDEFNVLGADLASATREIDGTGMPSIGFTLTADGASRMFNLTGQNLPDPVTGMRRRLAMVMDGQVVSAPTVVGQISDRGAITGRFTKQETDFLAVILQGGQLPVRLEATPVSEKVYDE